MKKPSGIVKSGEFVKIMDIRFESLGLRRGQNSAKEISEAYARASALKKPTPPGKPPRLLSAKRSRHNIGRFDLYAEKEKNGPVP